MHQIVIIPSNSQSPTALIYNTKESADANYKTIHEGLNKKDSYIWLSDDYGITLIIPTTSISYALVVDLEKQQELGVNQGVIKKN